MSGGAIAAGVIAARRRRLVKTFRDLKATSLQAAIRPEDHSIRQSFIFRRLRSSGVLVETTGGRFYLDEIAEREFNRQRRKLVLLMLGIMLVLLIVALIIGKSK